MHHASFFFFLDDQSTADSYTLSLHVALPISTMSSDKIDTIRSSSSGTIGRAVSHVRGQRLTLDSSAHPRTDALTKDRKSTRLNSSHQIISYAGLCLKKKMPEEGMPLTHDPHS